MRTLCEVVVWCNIFTLSAYTLYTLCNFGITHDLSCTFYYSERQRKGRGLLLSLLLLLIILTIIPVWVMQTLAYSSYRALTLLPIGVGCCLAMVMFTPRYKRTQRLVYLHYGAAITAAALSVVWALAVCPYLLCVVVVLASFLAVIAFLTATWKRCFLLYLELLAFYSVYIILLVLI